jgi:hypothetical protein
MIYARKLDDNLASLVKEFETLVDKNEDKKFAVLVAAIGGDVEELKTSAAEFASNHNISKAIVVVPSEQPDGPKKYGISADAATCVFLYTGKKVKAAHILPKDALKADRIATIVADADTILK